MEEVSGQGGRRWVRRCEKVPQPAARLIQDSGGVGQVIRGAVRAGGRHEWRWTYWSRRVLLTRPRAAWRISKCLGETRKRSDSNLEMDQWTGAHRTVSASNRLRRAAGRMTRALGR